MQLATHPLPAVLGHSEPTSLAAARLPASFIPRPQLVRRLQDEAEATTIALIAPAGYGKTSLLVEWAERDPRPFAWLELAPAHDAPEHLLVSLGSALASLREAGGEPASRVSPPRPADCVADLVALVERAAEPSASVLVLDNVDRLRSAGAREILGELALALPSVVTLAFAARGDPPLRLGRLRAAHRLLQLGVTDLAMSAYEAGRLLATAGVELDDARVRRLTDVTEGWPVGIYLGGRSLPGAPRDEPKEQGLAGREQIAEYLDEEMLEPLPDETRALLRRSSILDRLDGELCDAVLELEGSGQVLHDLAASGVMLSSPDGTANGYRCHALLREVLRAELETREPGEMSRLHVRAGAWLEARGEVALALDQASAARDSDLAGRLLWLEPARLLGGENARVERWLDPFPAAEIASSPALSLATAHVRLASGDLPAARQAARAAAEHLGGGSADPASIVLAASVAIIEAAGGSGGIEQVAMSAEQADSMLGETSPLRPLACVLRGVACHLLGAPEDARAHLEEGLNGGAAAAPLVAAWALTQLALMDIEEDDWERAGEHAGHAVGCLRASGLDDLPVAALSHATSALVLSQAGLADQAKKALTAAGRLLDSLEDYMPWYEVEARIVTARASTRLADIARARALLSQASRIARRPHPVPCLVAWMDTAWSEIDDASAAALSGPGALTMAELRILRFLPTHLSFREIGDRLHVSGNTVKSQAHAVYAKLGAGSRTEAVAHAAELGLIDPQVI